MRTVYDKRLQALETAVSPPETTRILVRGINSDGSLHSLYVPGPDLHFERQPAESDEAFEARTRAAVGWTDE